MTPTPIRTEPRTGRVPIAAGTLALALAAAAPGPADVQAQRAGSNTPTTSDSAAANACLARTRQGGELGCRRVVFERCVARRNAQTQLALTECAAYEWGVWDDVLNTTWQRIQREAGLSTAQMASLRAAQRAWITMRDADSAAIANQSGTIWPMIALQGRTDATLTRIGVLRFHLHGIGEAPDQWP